ncbi:uncharacterized protein LOC130763040 isoform X2 [Actinidia eriantha]|uniref:uncharacterized protein LOC130763040 isoform X2 n=1 Tax=Actinidia eriantha TaxID=165200 RepID=UPI00258D1C18|nr:uncharacterized protein LOC130763040 isoform X2 [Actinidia eriantha]
MVRLVIALPVGGDFPFTFYFVLHTEREREMGIMEFVNATTGKVKQNAPDLTSVEGACRSTYGYGWTTVAKIDNAVRENVVPTLNPYLPDDEGWAKIGRFATTFAKNTSDFAFHEVIKCVPGGAPVYKIALQSLRDEKPEDYKELLKHTQARLDKLERELANNQAKTLSPDVKVDPQTAPRLELNASLKPEDVIRIFMMKEFGGRYMFDDLVVPVVGRGKNHK